MKQEYTERLRKYERALSIKLRANAPKESDKAKK